MFLVSSVLSFRGFQQQVLYTVSACKAPIFLGYFGLFSLVFKEFTANYSKCLHDTNLSRLLWVCSLWFSKNTANSGMCSCRHQLSCFSFYWFQHVRFSTSSVLSSFLKVMEINLIFSARCFKSDFLIHN